MSLSNLSRDPNLTLSVTQIYSSDNVDDATRPARGQPEALRHCGEAVLQRLQLRQYLHQGRIRTAAAATPSSAPLHRADAVRSERHLQPAPHRPPIRWTTTGNPYDYRRPPNPSKCATIACGAFGSVCEQGTCIPEPVRFP